MSAKGEHRRCGMWGAFLAILALAALAGCDSDSLQPGYDSGIHADVPDTESGDVFDSGVKL